MGACLSGGGVGGGAAVMMIENGDGGEEEFHKRFLEDRVLGEGEFGVVKLVHDMTASKEAPPLACKTLRKGVVFKNNVVHAPLKPEILRGEISMLRALAGDFFVLELVSVYETRRHIYMVTELCAGGEMMEYVAQRDDDLHTEDVSRIANQLLSAIDHCAKHNVIHRDLKPENIMFLDKSPTAEIRIIDFGSGVLDSPDRETDEHTTFAGTAFYISPEMFQKKYTQTTDVWSIGVVMYVLVAGYPADQLQKAFNLLQKGKRNLKTLPNMPPDLPDSYYDLLKGLLVYKYRDRKAAVDFLNHDFVTFHKDLAVESEDVPPEILEDESKSGRMPVNRRGSVRLEGTAQRHGVIVGYQKFERQVTTLLATVLDKKQLKQLIEVLDSRLGNAGDSSEQKAGENADEDGVQNTHEMLDVIPIVDLKAIVKDEIKGDQVLEMIESLPNASSYNTFAYHTILIQEFATVAANAKAQRLSKDNTNPRAKRRFSASVRSGSIGAGLGRHTSDDLTSMSETNTGRGRNKFRGSFKGSFRAKRASSPVTPKAIKRTESGFF